MAAYNLPNQLYAETLSHLNRLVSKKNCVSRLLVLCPSPSFCCPAALTSCFIFPLFQLWPSSSYYFCSAFMTFTSAFHIAEPCSDYRNLACCPNLLLLRETTRFRLMNTLLFAFSPNVDWDAAVMRTTYQVGAAALRPRADLFYLRQMRVMFLPVLVLLCLRTS